MTEVILSFVNVVAVLIAIYYVISSYEMKHNMEKRVKRMETKDSYSAQKRIYAYKNRIRKSKWLSTIVYYIACIIAVIEICYASEKNMKILIVISIIAAVFWYIMALVFYTGYEVEF